MINQNTIPFSPHVRRKEPNSNGQKIHLAIVGHGTVGGALLDQIVAQRKEIQRKKGIEITVFAIANSRRLLLTDCGIESNWREDIEQADKIDDAVGEIIRYAERKHLENLIFVDNTSSTTIPERYEELVQSGFNLVSSNKVSNVQPYAGYKSLRSELELHNKSYRYETNVGAGLPLIDYLSLLHLSGDKITSIRGLFSGSLGYIFNALCASESLGQVIRDAVSKGFTESDPRIDLSGIDVARKVLILARELDLEAELEDVETQSLVPESLLEATEEEMWDRIGEFEAYLSKLSKIDDGEVIRYVGNLVMPEGNEPPHLSCGLERLPKNCVFGQVLGADSCFEIYTKNYGSQPIVIRGAGAGAAVTAQGVFGDILRTAEELYHIGERIENKKYYSQIFA